MKNINIPLKKTVDNSYQISIFEGSFDLIAEDMRKRKFGDQYIILTDSNTEKLFAKDLEKALKKVGIASNTLSVAAGEKSKKWNVIGKLLGDITSLGATRGACIIALGGGVVGDIAGFVASTYMRGINYVQIPTSLLAMVDSSIGGKTGVDLPAGKNLAGTFYQPKKVYMSLDVLKSLPEKEIRCGLAEIIKYGCIWDRSFFNFIEKKFKKMLKKQRKINEDPEQSVVDLSEFISQENKNFIFQLIQRSVEIKKTVVKKDEHETKNIRSVLNYGHTVGHAIEALSKFRLSHGEAISIGMHFEGKLAVKNNHLKEKELEKQDNLFKMVGLPIDLPKKMELNQILEYAKLDKKNMGSTIRYASIRKIGKPVPGYVSTISDKRFLSGLTNESESQA